MRDLLDVAFPDEAAAEQGWGTLHDCEVCCCDRATDQQANWISP